MEKKIIILFFIIFANNLFSQNYNFEKFSIEDGLSQSQVFSITQDIRGNMWFGTFGGAITVYNGKTTSYITTDDGLPHQSILELYTAPDGKIWIGTALGLAYYNGIKIINPLPEIEFGVRSICVDKLNNVWFAGDSGTYFYDWQDLKKIADSEVLKNEIFVDNQQNIYYSKSDGLYKFDGINEFLLLGINSITIYSFIQDTKNNIWVGTDHGLYKISSDFITMFSTKNGLPGNSIMDIVEDGLGNIWIATEENGISIYNGINFKNIDENKGIGFNHTMSLYKDKSNNIWIGIDGDGVYLFKGFKFRHLTFEKYFLNNFIMSVFVENDNKIWLGTDGNGVVLLENDKIDFINTSDGLIDNFVYSIIKDNLNNYWFATNNGLSKYDGHKFTNFNSDVIGYDNLMCLEMDSKNNIWVGTNGNGIVKISKDKMQFYNSENNLDASAIWDFYESTKGIFYISTDNGLYAISGQDTIHYTKEDGLYELNLGSLSEDKFGNIWIGSDSGISRFDGKNFRNYSTSDGLNSNMSYILTVAPNGKLIFGSEKGIDEIIFDENGDFKSIKFYGKDEGFTGIECNFNAVDFDSQGNIYFGTMYGLNIYDSKNDSLQTYEAFINISNVKLFYEEIDWLKYCDSIQPWSNLPLNPILNYKDNNLTFEFHGIDYLNPDKIKYKFMLEGFDKEWMPATTLNYATYSNIPPGNYIFKVVAVTSDNVENSIPATFSFTIKTPFWQTKIFYFFVVVFLIISILLLINHRTKKLIFEKIKLENIIEQRTAEIVQQKEEIMSQRDEIGQQKEEIEAQRDLATKQRDEIGKQKKDMTDSILYAKRIQTALLPRDAIFSTYFKEYFVIYKPKDIVSGDFYWLKKFEDNLVIAVGDCTGHGVPGAFMSLLGTAFLTEIVTRREITQTSEVLNELRKEIISSLKQDNQDDTSKDGIDIIICCYNLNSKVIQFSGAYNSLYLIRKDEENNFQLTEYFGDKMPIGIYFGVEQDFKNQDIIIQENDRIYLLTDGFYDQIDSLNSQKYMKSTLKAKLVDIQQFNLNDQKNILEAEFENWKGDAKQIDDILIIGLKI